MSLRLWGTLLIVLFIVTGYLLGIIFAPQPASDTIFIEKGMNAERIADLLKNNNVIRSKILFVWATYFGNSHDKLHTGRFKFEYPLSIPAVIRILSTSEREITVLIPEGSTLKEIAKTLKEKNLYGADAFLDTASTTSDFSYSFLSAAPAAATLEGFVFPDTYRFYESADANLIIRTTLDNFERKTAPLLPEIERQQKKLYDILVMASIIEREVQSKEDKAMVSGILWNRLGRDMALQVDAPFYYERGKSSSELTADDLKLDTPYNTYTNKGLPPGPIGNPGLESIEAAVFPKSNPYVYYLSDKEGKTHYARTFEEHVANKAKYLR